MSKITNENKNKIIASYFPDGKAFESKNITSTNFYKLLDALALNFLLFSNDLDEVAKEMNIATTEDLISRWEQEYGLPDDCLPQADSLQERINNILLKIGINGIQTVQDYIDLFTSFGYPIHIDNLSDVEVYPFDIDGYPIILTSYKYNRFTILVQLPEEFNEEVYPFDINGYPIILLDILKQNFIECLFRKIVPANVNVLFEYSL